MRDGNSKLIPAWLPILMGVIFILFALYALHKLRNVSWRFSDQSAGAPAGAPAPAPAAESPAKPPSAHEGQAGPVLRPPASKADMLDPSLQKEVEAAIDRALDWFAAQQKEDGSWSDGTYPAFTALPLWAFLAGDHPDKEEICGKAVSFILSCVQPDGGIYRKVDGKVGGGLSNYNTSIGMTALYLTGRDDLLPVVRKARSFIAASQHEGDDIYRGGLGYDQETGRKYTDLMNTLFGTEAMALTTGAEETRDPSEKKADLDWTAARAFLERLQNNESSGPEDYGGFPYRPDESKAGSTTNDAGTVVLRSYGSMTYAGLLTMIYCRVSRDDPRVKSAFDWAAKHWSLEENPGMGPQGLYFFLHVMSKALSAYGQESVPLKGGGTISWRAEMVKKLLSLQKTTPDGQVYWTNESGRFMESDPVLVTAYCVLALQMASGL